MSNALLNACWPLAMPPTPKSVLIALADYANDQGHCHPSIELIRQRTCFGKDAVIEAIAWLEGAGLVTADRSNGRHTVYRVTPSTFNSAYSRPSRRAAARTSAGQTTRAALRVAVGQPDGLSLGVRIPGQQSQVSETSRAEPPVGQTNRSGSPLDQSGCPVDQSGCPSKPVGQPDTNHQEPPLTTKNHQRARKRRVVEVGEGFLTFWSIYPQKVARPDAERAWAALAPDDELQTRICAAVALKAKSQRWREEGGRYVPYPATFLNKRRWEDEDVPAARRGDDGDWWREAGFEHAAEAQNARCHAGNFREFQNGQRLAAEVPA
jgi:hypothetical protein